MTRKLIALCSILALGISLPSYAKDSPEPQILDGLWSGVFDINDKGQYDFTALYIDGIVSAYSVGSNVVYRGTVIGNEKQYQSNMSMYIRDGTMFGTVQLKGTVGEQATSIIARYLTTGKDTGTLGLNYDPLFERPVQPSALAGLWEYISDKLSISFAVMPSGEVKGTDSIGCNYYGTIEAIRPGINALGVKLEMASCGTADGHYAGMAHVADSKTTNDTLHLSVTSDHFGLYYPLQRIVSAN